MEKSPNSRKKPSNSAEQHVENVPKSGERPAQGTEETNDHYSGEDESAKDNTLHPAPDNVGAKHRNPILAQPPEEFTGLRLGKPYTVAAGVKAVLKSMEFSWGEAGVGRGTHALAET